MIFAKVDVTLGQHHRVLRIPFGIRAEALGVWMLALLWTRGNERDGFCPLEAIDRVASESVVEKLVEVGLFAHESDEHGVAGVRVVRYEEHNETKSQIDKRKREDRQRKKAKKNRKGVLPDSDRNPCDEHSGKRGSDSDSGSVSPEERVQGEERSGLVLLPPADIEVTEEIRTQCAMAGARLPTQADVIACLSNARSKGFVRSDWGAELVKWMVRGRVFDRRTQESVTKPASRKAIAPLPPRASNG
jgi:hypothetical protein